MSRFLMVSFAGLALAFYELSGGADFTPPAHPTTDTQIQQATDSSTRNRIISRPAETQLATPVHEDPVDDVTGYTPDVARALRPDP